MYKWNQLGKSAVLIIMVAAISITVWLNSGSVDLSLDANDGELVELGKKIYLSQCASCHGENLEGQPDWRVRKEDDKLPAPPHDETGHTWHHSDKLLIDLTKQGPKSVAGPDYKTDMPAYQDILSDKEVVAVLSYIKNTWPENVRNRHDGLNRPNN